MAKKLKISDIHGVEYWSARELMSCLGYKKWSNFEGVVKRAAGIIKHKQFEGNIIETYRTVISGHGARRDITDYLVDEDARSVLQELCSSYKLNNFFSIRNETVVLQLVEKYCRKKGVDFQYQFHFKNFIFDGKIGDHILIEFDEPHHQYTRQKEIDIRKDVVADANGFSVYRVDLEMDIVDIIIYLEAEL